MCRPGYHAGTRGRLPLRRDEAAEVIDVSAARDRF
ncbi:hypothetical protein ABIA65_003043 [Mycolicibacterium sp. 624]